MCVLIFFYNTLGRTPWYLRFSFVHKEVTKVVCQHIVVSMLTVHIFPVPPQQKIVLFLELKLVKDVRHSSDHVQKGKKTKTQRDCIQKDVISVVGVVDRTPRKKISKIFSLSLLIRGKIQFCKEVCKGLMVVCTTNFQPCKYGRQCHKASTIANIL